MVVEARWVQRAIRIAAAGREMMATVMVHWATRAEVTRQRKLQTEQKTEKKRVAVEARWVQVGGMPEPREKERTQGEAESEWTEEEIAQVMMEHDAQLCMGMMMSLRVIGTMSVMMSGTMETMAVSSRIVPPPPQSRNWMS